MYPQTRPAERIEAFIVLAVQYSESPLVSALMILRWSKTLVWYQSGRCGFEAAIPGPPRGRPAPIGDITNGEMRLNDFGRLAKAAWEEIPLHFPDIELGTFVAMPNHIHGIIVIARPTPRATPASPLPIAPGPPKRSLGTIVGSYKSAVTKGINQSRGAAGAPVWQRNYYEHIIRDDADLNRIRQYTSDNAARWHEDPENPYIARRHGTSTISARKMPDNLRDPPCLHPQSIVRLLLHH